MEEVWPKKKLAQRYFVPETVLQFGCGKVQKERKKVKQERKKISTKRKKKLKLNKVSLLSDPYASVAKVPNKIILEISMFPKKIYFQMC